MTFDEAVQKHLGNGFIQIERHQERRFVGGFITADGKMTLAIVAQNPATGEVKSQIIEDAEKNNPKAFEMAMKFKERGLW